MRSDWGGRVRRALLRTAYLLTGAAICVAFLLLQTGLVTVVRDTYAVPLWLAVPVVAVPVFLLGLLPGVREVEVAAVRSLLGVDAELIMPRRLQAAHRRRSAAWVTLHVVVGGAAGLGLVVGVPTALSTQPPTVAVLIMIAVLAAVVLTGWLLAQVAPWFLGPTWRDRLELAEERLARDAEHRGLARDLHDGVGHALSAISLQAAAGRRVLSADPAQAAESMITIEETARAALDELDTMLGVLRDGVRGRTPQLGAESLSALLRAHRDLGSQVDAEIELSDGLPTLVGSTVYRVVAEGLANAGKHGLVGEPVRVLVSSRDGVHVDVVISNAVGARIGRPTRGGRGLTGLRERVGALGGSLDVGADDRRWTLHARVPTGRRP